MSSFSPTFTNTEYAAISSRLSQMAASFAPLRDFVTDDIVKEADHGFRLAYQGLEQRAGLQAADGLSVTLTTDGFKDLHNGLCKFYHVENLMQEVICPERLAEFSAAFAAIETEAMERIRAVEEAFEDSQREYFRSIADTERLMSVWSMDEVRVGGMDDVAFQGKWELKYPETAQAQKAPIVVEDPTWRDLWKAAETLIFAGGPTNHVFIEDFTADGQTLVLSTGS